MSITHLLKDTATISRAAKTFTNGRWEQGTIQPVMTGIPARLGLARAGQLSAVAGQEDATRKVSIWFGKGTVIEIKDIIETAGQKFEVTNVISNADAPYVAAECRRII